MPGISANLTPQAYAIWDTIPKKEAGNPDRPGRSVWISTAIIEHRALTLAYNAVLKEKFQLEDKLGMMTASRDKLQEIVLERSS